MYLGRNSVIKEGLLRESIRIGIEKEICRRGGILV